MAGRILIGTSGWADPDAIAEWYPPGLPAEDRLAWYARHFEAVELNASYYAIPERASAERWADVTPDRFRFAVKAHRLLSQHAAGPQSLPPSLRDGVEVNAHGGVVVTDDLQRALAGELLHAVAPLAQAGKLSAFLVQLSPAFTPRHNELEELDTVLGALAPYRVAVELRHHGWARRDRIERVGAYLARWNAAWVHSGAATSRLGYVRLRGAGDDDALHVAASRARALARQGREVHLYVSARGAEGPRAAQRLRELVGQVEPAGVQLRLAG